VFLYDACANWRGYEAADKNTEDDEWSYKGYAGMIMIYSSRGRISQYQLNRRLDRTQNPSRCCGEDINLLPLLRIELRFLGCPSGSLITILTETTPLHTVQIIANFQNKEGNLAPPVSVAHIDIISLSKNNLLLYLLMLA